MHPDFKDLLSEFNARRVEYLVVGAHALAAHGHVRDILTSITGVEFGEAWLGRLQTTFDGEPVGVLSRQHLIQNNSATGRPQDMADVHFLKTQLP